ncbi:hypothetical protein LINPERPRIM_LOCUS15693 [Linum perenne]
MCRWEELLRAGPASADA